FSQRRALLLKVLTHNIMILWRSEVFDRARTIYLIDYIALLISVQVVLALGMTIIRQEHDVGGWIPVTLLIALLLGFLWWAGIDTLSHLDVRQASRRLIVHLVILPGACAIMPGTVVAFSFAVQCLSGWSDIAEEGFMFLTSALVVAVATWLIRSMSYWIVRGATPTPVSDMASSHE
ncbi:MAG TPA: hypothetical protein VL096_18925, partial [Pirellulaceae bacterium]|nr:hypothetical protein [Pirellulaceae bacterium]